MFRPSLIRSAHVHKPSFRFPDRKAPKQPHTPHPHPAAPPSVVEKFQDFQKTLASGPHFFPEKLVQASSSAAQPQPGALASAVSGDREVAEDVHLLPERFWKTHALLFEEAEMEAVMVSIECSSPLPFLEPPFFSFLGCSWNLYFFLFPFFISVCLFLFAGRG
ncbi:hypothetical protein IE53DRAFT_383557 [Violaceomyces palustris]|uniref:Uncharacterized protein n=1 Tax=Violaceomyces palustris TaxID=1673888 RepID=A0ACD0P7D8_9BASI|nr:hypothetical protein IE53DRAFT_383557 [Violaceomyces palustris]